MVWKVLTHFKRRFQQQDARSSQPPELRRWSDFTDPFPHVAAGGYTKYYKSHGLLDDDSVALPQQTKSDNLLPVTDISLPRRRQKRVNPCSILPPIQIPTQPEKLSASDSSTSSTTLLSTSPPSGTKVSIPNSTVTTSVSIIHHSSKMSLLGIPEGAAAAMEFRKRRQGRNSHSKHASEGSRGSLRRRKRRMLRISGELDPVFMISLSGLLSSLPPDNIHLECPPLTASADSHSTDQHAFPTTPTTLCDQVDHVVPKIWCHEHQSSHKNECGYPLSERSDSRASFRTAKSEFDNL